MIARAENRSAGALVRDMVRVYRRHYHQQERPDLSWANRVIAEAQAEEATSPITPEEFRAQLTDASRYGQKQARKLGIKQKDIIRIIHEYRQSRMTSRRP